MTENKSVFDQLNAVDVEGKLKTKNGLKYLSWSSAWAEVKKRFPDATSRTIPQIMDGYRNTRPWHDDGNTGWVEVGVTIEGLEVIETLAIMDFKNKSIPAADITSTDANKALKRCLVKAIAEHGLGLYVYEGEDMPEETSRIIELRDEITDLINKKCKLSDNAKEKVAAFCKSAEKKASPYVAEEDITGNPKNIDDVDILESLKKQLLTVRK